MLADNRRPVLNRGCPDALMARAGEAEAISNECRPDYRCRKIREEGSAMKTAIFALLVASASSGLTAPAHAQYTGGGSTQLPTTDTMDPTALYKQAVEYIQSKDYVRAVPLLRDVLARREQDPASNLMMGVAQIGLGDLREAQRHLVRAVSEKPDLADAIGRLGWVQARLGNADEAAKQRQKLVSLKDRCKAACPDASAIESGIALIDGVAAVAKISAAARFNQGIDHIAARNWSEAIVAFNDVLAAKPDDYEAALMKGQAQAASGDYLGAKVSLQAALRLQPNLVEASGRLGWVEAKLGNTSSAAKIRAELMDLKSKAPGAVAAINDAIAVIDTALAN
jgi:tetratricopeptide (TPR) repeat protein